SEIETLTYKETNKKRREEDLLSSDVELQLLELDKTGNYLVSKKQFMRILDYSETYAKKLENELKEIKDKEMRKSKLIEIIQFREGNKQGKSRNEIKESIQKANIKSYDLPPVEMDNLNILATRYSNFIERDIVISKQNIADYVELRQAYKFEDIEYVVRGLLRAAK